MNLSRIFFIVLIAALLFSCGKSEKELAADRLALAKNAYQKGDTTLALQQLDTIQLKYRGAIQTLDEADQFKKKIYGDLFYQKQDEMDSLKVKLEKLEAKFVKEKTDFDRYTQYVHKRQQFERRWDKSFIQIHLDERGELYDQDLQAKTEKVDLDNVLNHRSDFMETKWEKVSYRDGADNGVIEFIAEHADRNLKAVFLGSRYYYIILEEYDKQAVKDALALSKLLKQKAKLGQEIQSLQSKVG